MWYNQYCEEGVIMSDLYDSLSGENLGPFENAALFAFRFSAMLIMDKACVEVSQLEHDVEVGLNDLELPAEVRAQVLGDYVAIKDRWDLLLSSPLCVD